MALADLANWAEVLGAVLVIAALLVGGMEYRAHERRRREEHATALLLNFQNAEWSDAIRVVWRIPDGTRASEVAANPEWERAALRIAMTGALGGFMVHERMIPLRLLAAWEQGVMRIAWRKLQAFVEAAERKGGREVWHWFRWLVAELERYDAHQGLAVPAPPEEVTPPSTPDPGPR